MIGMKKLLAVSEFLYVALFVALMSASCMEAHPLPAMSAWQYRVLYVPAPKAPNETGVTIKVDEAAMAAVGGDGWELVSSYEEYNTVFPNFSQDQKIVTGIESNVRPTQLVLIFKKPLTK